jgi:catechol 2,3-dioxygenase-like lactoylglutathione lyase family enzyme
MDAIFKRIDTVFLKVKDFDRAIDWYSNILGFTVRWKDEEGGYAALNIGETALTLVRDYKTIKITIIQRYTSIFIQLT